MLQCPRKERKRKDRPLLMLRKWRGEEGKLRIDFYSLPTDGKRDREKKNPYARRKKPLLRTSDSQTVKDAIFFRKWRRIL